MLKGDVLLAIGSRRRRKIGEDLDGHPRARAAGVR
jgi:hypothetical protein